MNFRQRSAHLDTTPTQGGAELPLCPDLTGREPSDAGGHTVQNSAALVLVEVWAERQRLSQNHGAAKFSPSLPSDGGESRGEEVCFHSEFPSPRSSPHSFLAGRGRRSLSYETVSAAPPYLGGYVEMRTRALHVNLLV